MLLLRGHREVQSFFVVFKLCSQCPASRLGHFQSIRHARPNLVGRQIDGARLPFREHFNREVFVQIEELFGLRESDAGFLRKSSSRFRLVRSHQEIEIRDRDDKTCQQELTHEKSPTPERRTDRLACHRELQGMQFASNAITPVHPASSRALENGSEVNDENGDVFADN